jgi:hypothetical protein
LAYLRPIFFESARKVSFEKSWHLPEAIILFRRSALLLRNKIKKLTLGVSFEDITEKQQKSMVF